MSENRTDMDIASEFASMIAKHVGYDSRWIHCSDKDDNDIAVLQVYLDKRVAGELVFDVEGKLLSVEGMDF